MKKQTLTQIFVVANLVILNTMAVACSSAMTPTSPTPESTATLVLTPTQTLTVAPTIALSATIAATPTETSPQLDPLLAEWVSEVEIQISDFRSFEEGVNDDILMTGFKSLRDIFPESKGNSVMMTERGDVAIINKTTNLMAFGQMIVGKNGSSYTFLVTKAFSDLYNTNVLQANAGDYLIYPNLVDNVEKEEILRILGTLVDVMEGKIDVQEDLETYTPQKSINYTQILATAKEINAGINVRDFSYIENSVEDNIFNKYYGFGTKYRRESTRYFFTLCNGKPEIFSRVVKSDNGAYLSAIFTSFCDVNWDFNRGEDINYLSTWGYKAITEAYDNLWRESLVKYYFPAHPLSERPLGSEPWYVFKSYPLRHVYDNYPPMDELISGFRELRSQTPAFTEWRKVDYYNYYIKQVNIVNVSSLR